MISLFYGACFVVLVLAVWARIDDARLSRQTPPRAQIEPTPYEYIDDGECSRDDRTWEQIHTDIDVEFDKFLIGLTNARKDALLAGMHKDAQPKNSGPQLPDPDEVCGEWRNV